MSNGRHSPSASTANRGQERCDHSFRYFIQRGVGRGEDANWTTDEDRYVIPAWLERFGTVIGCLGDLCRATSGEGETEPKQIGEGTDDSTERQHSP